MRNKLINAPTYIMPEFFDLKGYYIRRDNYIVRCDAGFGLLTSPQKIFGKAWKIVAGKLIEVEGFNWTRRHKNENVIIGLNHE